MYILRSFVGGVLDIHRQIPTDTAMEARQAIRKVFPFAKVTFSKDLVYVKGNCGERLKLFYRQA